MPKLDKLKEQLGVLKFWLGTIVAIIVGIIGYTFANFQGLNSMQIVVALLSLIPLCIIVVVINIAINNKLDEIEKE
ncbi:hypothetical protein [Campylobacter curvus]|uniref:hypothetical protein n=1 Tax=Campylobacter curvus TaxID=200 RepID=UPI00036A302B|nr:hypothetical protein [Campylobacter curvus]UEB49291.1 hypothetical protein LK426_06590 [Campylobacter curvus]